MRHRDAVQYPKNTTFTQEQLAAITAGEIVAYFNFCAYGRVDQTPDNRPKQCRSKTLYYWKKALSAFMPNKNYQWNEITNVGNPTKSQAVNNMINKVKKIEACKQGVPTKARRPMKEAKFRAIVAKLRGTEDSNDVVNKYGIPAVMVFQFHLIRRLDDCCKWMRANLKPHNMYPNMALKAKLCWGKNVHKEHNAPLQHIFGCMDWMYCCLLNVGVWLEVFHSSVHGPKSVPLYLLSAMSYKTKKKLPNDARIWYMEHFGRF